MAGIRIGLTGGMASGKSTVGKLLDDAGFTVVDADELVGALYQPGAPGTQQVVALFGSEYLAEDGSVDHNRLADLVFQDAAARRRLEEAIHPLVRSEFTRRVAEAPIAILEATLLVEAGYEPDFDLVVSVETRRETQLSRAIARGTSEEDALARLEAQGDGVDRRDVADVILYNNGTLEDLQWQVDRLAAEIRELAADRG